MKIGVFDSGIGGKSVADAIERAFPEDQIRYVNDVEHVPYGTKTPEELFSLVVPILQGLVDDGCRVIVIACNTVTTTLIDRLREYFAVPFIGIEPMVKPAALVTTSGTITVCATPATLKSARYQWLKETYAGTCTVIEPDCSDWAELIEQNEMNEAKIRADIEPALAQGADVIVLGCTHYHWIEEDIRSIVGPNVAVLQPETAIAAQLQKVIAQLPVAN